MDDSRTGQIPVPDNESAATEGEPVRDSGQLFLTLLFVKYRGSLHRYLSGLTSSSEDAAELVQESYVRLIKRGGISQVEAIARGYLFQTATNLARDHFRRRRVRRTDAQADLDQLGITDGGAGPERSLMWAQTIQAIKEEIRDLPPLTRRIFLLSRFREKTYPEIAQLLGISTRTVERRMRQAMQALSAHVGEQP